MNRTELVEVVKEIIETKANVKLTKKVAGEIVNEVFEKILNSVVESGEVVLPELGKLKLVETSARSGEINGKKWEKPAGKTIKLRLSSKTKEKLS